MLFFFPVHLRGTGTAYCVSSVAGVRDDVIRAPTVLGKMECVPVYFSGGGAGPVLVLLERRHQAGEPLKAIWAAARLTEHSKHCTDQTR